MSTTTDESAFPMTCPDCKGKGEKYLHLHYAKGKGQSGWQWKPCWRCNGTKVIDEQTFNQIVTGTALNDMLKAKGLMAYNGHESLGLTDPCELSSAVMGRLPVERIDEIIRMVEAYEGNGK